MSGARRTRRANEIMSKLVAAAGLFSCGCKAPSAARPNETLVRTCAHECRLEVSPRILEKLLEQEDTDSDRRITILDKGPGRFSMPVQGGGSYPIEGTYHLANLVQEIYLRRDDPGASVPLERIEEPILERLSRLIRESYWDVLTRRIDEESLDEVLSDSKTDPKKSTSTVEWPAGCTAPPEGVARFLYVPHGDAESYEYYSAMRGRHVGLVVCRLPETITPAWVRRLDANASHGSRHGLLTLAVDKDERGTLEALPYGVPGGRFNEMYGWDSYFHVRGLLSDKRTKLARAMVENQLYEVTHYGKVLNANRTYYLTRSQPPFLSSSVRAIWQETGPSVSWLKSALGTLEREYHQVWASGDRLTPLCAPFAEHEQGDTQDDSQVCLAAYHAAGIGEPPEVEPGHFDWLYEDKANHSDLSPSEYRTRYQRRELPAARLEELDRFFLHDRSMRESGHDTTYRWTTERGDECANFATIDLNALLFKYELDLAYLTKESGGSDWKRWCDRAATRRELIQDHLYDGRIFVDAEMIRSETGALARPAEKSDYVSATTLFTLWASTDSPCTDPSGSPLSLFSNPEQARRLVDSALAQLEAPGGLVSTSRASIHGAPNRGIRQWDFPFGWAPHQILAWEGLRRHGFHEDADRLTYRWLYTIAKNAHDYHGTVPEKFDVVKRSHLVFAEYGNVGSEFSYITKEGFGWMNASFQLGLESLPGELKRQLNRLVPPERIDTWKQAPVR